MSAPVRAVAYYRMSTLKQEDSIDRQKSQVLPYAQKHGYPIVREYIDEGIGGDEIAKRKDFQRLLRDAQAGHFDVILCDDKDRFGRFDSIDSGEVVAPLRRKGVWLETVAQGRVDWESFAGRITDAVLQEAKNLELDAISRRVLSNQLLKAQKGIDTGSRAPYGYRWEPDPEFGKKLTPDGHRAEVVRRIFEWYDQGWTLTLIAEELWRRHVSSPRGAPRWTRSVIQRLLSNRRYVGDWTWGVHPQGKRHTYRGEIQQTPRGKRRPRRSLKEDWVVKPNHHEPLIDRETFERVQARLAGNQTLTAPKPGGGNFALSRLLVCGHCGCFLVGVTDRGWRKYVCRGYLAHGSRFCHRNSVPEKGITRVLVRKLQQAYLDPVHLRELRQGAEALEADLRSEANLIRLQKRIEELDRQIAKGNERLTTLPDDRIPGLVATLRLLEQERKAVRDELRRVETESPVQKLEDQVALAESVLWRLEDAMQAENVPLFREIMRELVERVTLHWTHRQAGKVTRAKFLGGEIVPRASPEPSMLYPSAGRSRC